jgi:hypothetical protein
VKTIAWLNSYKVKESRVIKFSWQDFRAESVEVTMFEAILQTLAANPFSAIQEMDLNRAKKWKSFEQTAAVAGLAQSSTAVLHLRGANLKASVSCSPLSNVIILDLADEDFTKVDETTIKTFARNMAQTLPAFSNAGIDADPVPDDFYAAQKLRQLPDSLNWCLKWYTLVSPRGYAKYFERADLLATPAKTVTELDNAWIEMVAYANPFAFANFTTRQRIIEITNYLNDKRKDKK